MGDEQPPTDGRAPLAPGDLRASDAERQATVDLLRDHTAAGRLQMDECEERVGQAFAARTRRDLQVLLRDLPGGGPVQVPAVAPPARRARPGTGTVDPVRPAWPAPEAGGPASGVPAWPAPGLPARRVPGGGGSTWGDITGGGPVGSRPGRHGHPHHHGHPSRHDGRPQGRWRRVRHLGFSTWFVELAVLLTGVWGLTDLHSGQIHYFWPAWPLASMAFFGGGWRPGRHRRRRALPGESG